MKQQFFVWLKEKCKQTAKMVCQPALPASHPLGPEGRPGPRNCSDFFRLRLICRNHSQETYQLSVVSVTRKC